MKRKLQGIYWCGILITLAMVVAAVAVSVKLKIDDTRVQLSAFLEAAVEWTKDSNHDLQTQAEEIAGILPGLRVTFLLDSGIILADTEQDAQPQRNHFSDKEIEMAMRGETGRHLRMSQTSATFMLYMARQISPQLVIRLSYPVFEIAQTLTFYGMLLLVLFLILYQIQRRSIARFARDQNRQFDDVRRLLDGEVEGVDAVFPEFQPTLDAIAYRVRRLQEDHEEILRAMNLRNEFVANASHELRSPLTSVRGFAEMLEENLAETPEEQALCVHLIHSECDRMLAVIEDILHLSKAERKTDIPNEYSMVLPVVQEVCKALQPQAAQKEISMRIEGNASVRANEKDLWEILYNLVDNAIRYGRHGGYVQIRMNESSVAVLDDGIGIAPEHLGHIFEQFYRVDEARDSTSPGTGLGLSIVRAIVMRLGGTIQAESQIHQGTRILMSFPAEVVQ